MLFSSWLKRLIARTRSRSGSRHASGPKLGQKKSSSPFTHLGLTKLEDRVVLNVGPVMTDDLFESSDDLNTTVDTANFVLDSVTDARDLSLSEYSDSERLSGTEKSPVSTITGSVTSGGGAVFTNGIPGGGEAGVDGMFGLPASVERAAQVAFHGDDLVGKDGPLSSVGLDLARLYFEYNTFLESGYDAAFESAIPLLTIVGDQVAVDFRADGDVDEFQRGLEEFGVQVQATFGPIISGLLPM